MLINEWLYVEVTSIHTYIHKSLLGLGSEFSYGIGCSNYWMLGWFWESFGLNLPKS